MSVVTTNPLLSSSKYLDSWLFELKQQERILSQREESEAERLTRNLRDYQMCSKKIRKFMFQRNLCSSLGLIRINSVKTHLDHKIRQYAVLLKTKDDLLNVNKASVAGLIHQRKVLSKHFATYFEAKNQYIENKYRVGK